MYERPRVNVKVERGSTFTYTPDLVTFDTLSLFYLRAYARKKYATVEIHLKSDFSEFGWSFEHHISETNSVTPQFFYIFDMSNP